MRAGCRVFVVAFISLFSLFSLGCPARADDKELREFSIFVNGKEAGVSRMSIIQKNDGTTYVSASVDVKFRQILTDFTLKIETQEWWKNGRLVGMKTTTVENGKKTEITVALDNDQLRMRVGAKESLLKPEVWTNSYWKLADARFHNKQVPILEVDSGKEITCELRYVGTEKLKIGEFQDCYHFRVMAPSGPVDLWFDRYHRLVRQEFTEAGHKTIVQLTKVNR